MALEAGFTGIGVQQKGTGRFLHLDTLENLRPTVWSY
jgi:zinc D-Ala-D-Ala carboxypeptidase